MKKIFILFSAIALLNSCVQNEDRVSSETAESVESLKYVLPDGKAVTVTFNKETGIPVDNKDFAQFKAFVDANKNYTTFIDSAGNMKLLKNKNELNEIIKKENESVSAKDVIGLNCSGYVKLCSDNNYSTQLVNYTTTQTKGLVAAGVVQPYDNTAAYIMSNLYAGYINYNSSISSTQSIKMKNCMIKLTLQNPYIHFAGNRPPGDAFNENPRISYFVGSSQEVNVPKYFWYNGKYEFFGGNLAQIIYDGNCYQTS